MSDNRELILQLRRQISKLQSREIGYKAMIKGLERECLRLQETIYSPQEERVIRDSLLAAYKDLNRPLNGAIIEPYRIHVDEINDYININKEED